MQFGTHDPAAARIAGIARDGLGIVFALSYQVQALVAKGELRVVLQSYEAPPILVSVILPSGRLQPARVKALADFLQARIGAKNLSKLRTARNA